MRLSPNTYTGLVWGLTNFDAIETDLRLTKDDGLAIFHDSALPSGERIADLTIDEVEERGIPSLRKFFALSEVVELSKNRAMFLELKPDCDGKILITKGMGERFLQAFNAELKASEVDPQAIRFLSFSTQLLDPFVDQYPCYPIFPNVSECVTALVVLRAMPQVIFKSLGRTLDTAVKRRWAGVFFARQYIFGITSWFHPSYEKLVRKAEQLGLLLGTNLGTPDLEEEYSALARFTDKLQNYPRRAKDGEGFIVAHRGTGTKGVEVPEADVPSLSID